METIGRLHDGTTWIVVPGIKCSPYPDGSFIRTLAQTRKSRILAISSLNPTHRPQSSSFLGFIFRSL